jgi:hypothetical protein
MTIKVFLETYKVYEDAIWIFSHPHGRLHDELKYNNEYLHNECDLMIMTNDYDISPCTDHDHIMMYDILITIYQHLHGHMRSGGHGCVYEL